MNRIFDMEFNGYSKSPHAAAARAITALQFGIEFENVATIAVAVGDPSGWGLDEDRRNALINKWVMVLLAGDVAEEIQSEQEIEESEALLTAYFLAAARSPQGTNDELQKYLEWLRVRARNLIIQESTWAQIERIAEALEQKGDLSYAEVAALAA